MTEKKVHKPKACRLCGKLFIPRQSGTHYCDECRARVLENYIKHIKDGEPFHDHCLVCGKEIPRKIYRSKTVCGKQCGTTLFALTVKWRMRNGFTGTRSGTPHLIGDKTRKGRKKKPISHLGEDIAEARHRGISYGLYMAAKAQGGVSHGSH